MDIPVDLTNLRSMTDGDAAMEQELFKEFFSSFEAGMEKLKANTAHTASEAWRKEAHGLKGMALNLGAMKLGEWCKKAQDDLYAGADAKDELIKHIRAEYEQVRQFLMKT